jgi:Carboxypeptidase regulatory-like domain
MPVRMQPFPAIVGFALSGAVMLIAATTGASAQGAPRLVRVEGTAYDSLATRPLPGAFVSATGTGRSTTSDSKGRFRLDSVPEGEHTLTMQHAAFDSLGLSGASVRVVVRNRMPRVTLAVPSFSTLWRAACGAAEIPAEGTLLYGALRDATNNAPLAERAVEGGWTELVGGGRTMESVGQRRWRLSTVTDARGEYVLCGVGMGTPITLRVPRDTSSSGPADSLEVLASMTRVRRQDMLIATAAPQALREVATFGTDSSRTASAPDTTSRPSAVGVISGIVTNAAGTPVGNAAVAVDTFPEVRTNDEGRFFVREVPAGSRQVGVVAIGLQPSTTTVNLLAGDTARLSIPLGTAQSLGAVRVTATILSTRLRDIEERKRMGFGDQRDSTEIRNYPSLIAVLRTINGVRVRQGASRLNVVLSLDGCGAVDYRVDGHPSTIEDIALLDAKDIAAIEVYRRTIPSELMSRRGCPVVVWTKRGLGR